MKSTFAHRYLFGLILFCFDLSAQPIDETQYDETIRVACIGNSLTYGFGPKDRDTESYSAVLQQKLGVKYDVKNFGINGATLLRKGHRPYWDINEDTNSLEFRPHIIVIHLGLNDTDPRSWPNYRDDFFIDFKVLIDSYLSIDMEQKPKIWVCRMTPIFHGHPADVHPKHKKPIGQRLALCAEALTYSLDKEYSGPRIRQAVIEDGKIVVSFTHANGLHSMGEELTGFEIAGEDMIYRGIRSKIVREKLIIFPESIYTPAYRRCAWKPYAEAELYNVSGLPTSTFQQMIE